MTPLNSKKLLESSGELTEWTEQLYASYTCIDGASGIQDLPESAAKSEAILIEFASSADGRGFSLVRHLIHQGYQGRLIATGALNPDQVSLAFQCGYDGVLVTEEQITVYGITAWETALAPPVRLSYPASRSNQVQSIWEARH